MRRCWTPSLRSAITATCIHLTHRRRRAPPVTWRPSTSACRMSTGRCATNGRPTPTGSASRCRCPARCGWTPASPCPRCWPRCHRCLGRARRHACSCGCGPSPSAMVIGMRAWPFAARMAFGTGPAIRPRPPVGRWPRVSPRRCCAAPAPPLPRRPRPSCTACWWKPAACVTTATHWARSRPHWPSGRPPSGGWSCNAPSPRFRRCCRRAGRRRALPPAAGSSVTGRRRTPPRCDASSRTAWTALPLRACRAWPTPGGRCPA